MLGEFHGQRSLVGYSPWGRRVGNDCVTNTMYTYAFIMKGFPGGARGKEYVY